MSKKKHDKEVATLRAQVEALKGQLTDKEKPATPENKTNSAYSYQNKPLNIKPGISKTNSATGGNKTTVDYDLSYVKKDFSKVLILTVIAFGMVVALKIFLPKLVFLPFL